MTEESKEYWSGGRGFDMRHVPGPVYLEVDGGRAPHQALWVKPFDALRPVDGLTDAQRDLAALAYVCDYTILEPVLRVLDLPWAQPGLVTASLDHAMWFHRPPAPGRPRRLAALRAGGRGGRVRPGRGPGPLLHPRRRAPRDRRPGGHDPHRHRRPVMSSSSRRQPLPERPHRHLRPRPPAHRWTSGRRWSSRRRSCSTPSGSTPRWSCSTRPSRTHGAGPPGAAHARRHDVDLRRAARADQPGRRRPHRGPRPRARQPRPAALPQHPVDRGRLAGHPQGRRRRRHDDGGPARPRARAHRREDPAGRRAGGPPLRRGRRGRARHRGPRPRGRALRRGVRRRPHPPRAPRSPASYRPPSTPPPTTSRSSGRPRAAPGSPRSRRTSTATCCPSTTPSAATCCG